MPDEEEKPDLGKLLNDAVQVWLTSQGGGFTTAYYMAVEYVDKDGEPAWTYATAEDQRMGTTLGVLAWSTEIAKFEAQEYFRRKMNGD